MSLVVRWLDEDAQELAAVACVRGGARWQPSTLAGVCELIEALLARADALEVERPGWSVRLRALADELGDGVDALPASVLTGVDSAR